MAVVTIKNRTTYRWPDDIIAGVEKGEISPAQAFLLLRNMDGRRSKGLENNPVKAAADEAIEELDTMVGLVVIKQIVRELQALLHIQQRRSKVNLINEPLVLHMIFTGNPGTGKTTVARIIGKILQRMGVLTQGHLIEVERADLVGEYIGHTAQKTREQIKKALGGILFIDEAYSLARGGEKDFGKEAIDCLVKAMEDHKQDFVLILAGYPREMAAFLDVNPGLRSRFPMCLDFPDYSQQELLAIAEQMCHQKQYLLSVAAKERLSCLLMASANRDSFGNARTVRNLLEQAIRRQAVRLVKKEHTTREELMTIEPDDLAEVAP